MRLTALCFLLMTVLFSACLKKETGCEPVMITKTAPSAEELELTNYLTSNGISATKHGSNMYYQVVSMGTGDHPQYCSIVQVSYAGKLTNGTVFEENKNIYLKSWILIDGWKIGLPLIKKGGRIKLYIPPYLGYGSTERKDMAGNIVIPANSILIYDISLEEVQ